MRLPKKELTKAVAKRETKPFTINSLLFKITGSRAGARWHQPMFVVSKSTVRRALNELVESGELRAWYRIGHCFDECLYEVKNAHSKIS